MNAASKFIIEADAKPIVSQIVFRIRGMRMFSLRARVGGAVIRFGAWITGMTLEMEID
jgi:hypothetical protein